MVLFREMDPVLTALLVAGRVGSGLSAGLGSTLVTDQIDAMRSLTTNPIEKPGIPRVLATILIMPLYAESDAATDYRISRPPSRTRVAPVAKSVSHKNSTPRATSSGLPSRLVSVARASASICSGR